MEYVKMRDKKSAAVLPKQKVKLTENGEVDFEYEMKKKKDLAMKKQFRKPDRSRLEDVFLIAGDPQKYVFEGVSQKLYDPPAKIEKYMPDSDEEEPLEGDDALEDIITKKLE